MNHAGEIRTLVGIAEPDVRIWTNVGDAHIGFFGMRDAVAAAKAEILEASTATTLSVLNAGRFARDGRGRQRRGPRGDVRDGVVRHDSRDGDSGSGLRRARRWR